MTYQACVACGQRHCYPAGHQREIERLRSALDVARSALLDVKATRSTDAWGVAVASASDALTVIEEAV